MEKYYTPEISEFYVGFECYVLGMIGKEDGTEQFHRQKIIFTKEDFNTNHCRVIEAKYLDQTDIEELGWKQLTDIWVLESGGRLLNLGHYDEDKTQMYIDDHQTKVSYFIGYIKNKSELKKLMQMTH